VPRSKEKHKVDSQWFARKFAERGVSQNEVAAAIEMDKSSFSKVLSGNYGLNWKYAMPLARVLDEDLTEIYRRFGVEVPLTGRDVVQIEGTADMTGAIVDRVEGVRTVESPQPDRELKALRLSLPGHAGDGWLAFYKPAPKRAGVPANPRGQVYVVKTAKGGQRFLCTLHSPGSLYPVPGLTQSFRMDGVELAWATPVLWLKTGV
jgi:DNA-binding XRE family transcriptional regulator